MENENGTVRAAEYEPEAMLSGTERFEEPTKAGEIPEYADDPAVNIALVIGVNVEGRAALKKLSDTIIRNFDDAWRDSEERREQAGRAWKYFAGAVPRSWKPHEHAADVNIPIVLENISRVSWRSYQELFGDFQAILDVAPLGTGADEAQIASKMTLHDNWQFCEQFTEFPREMHRAVLLHYLVGDWVTVSMFTNGRNYHETLGPDDYVVPWVNVSTAVDYSDVPFFVRIRHFYPHEIEEHAHEWQGVGVVKENKASWSDDPQQDVSAAVQHYQGILTDPGNRAGAPRKVLQYEGWLMLPRQTEQRYCRALVDYATGEIFWLSLQEEVDERDKERFERQQGELEQYRASMFDFAGGQLQEKPLAPTWIPGDADLDEAEPEPPKRTPLHLRAHGVCIEPVKGPLGLGMGIIAMQYNEAANWALDTFLDQVNQSASKGYLTTNKKLADRGTLVVAPGSITYVPMGPMELKDALREVDGGTPNPQCVSIVQMMADFGQRSTHASDVMSGRPGKSGESAKGQNERLEQAMAMLSVSASKFIPAFEQIARNNAKLNAVHLKDEQFFQVTRAIPMPMGLGNIGSQSVARSFYARKYAVKMRADARFISKQQRVQEADAAFSMCGHPLLAGNVDLARYALVKAFEARGRWDLIERATKGWQQQDLQAKAAAEAAGAQGLPPPGAQPPAPAGAPPGQPPPNAQQRPPAPPQGPPRPQPQPQRPPQ